MKPRGRGKVRVSYQMGGHNKPSWRTAFSVSVDDNKGETVCRGTHSLTDERVNLRGEARVERGTARTHAETDQYLRTQPDLAVTRT